jgi:hypothetical protein
MENNFIKEEYNTYGWKLIEIPEIKNKYPIKMWNETFLKISNDLKVNTKNMIDSAYKNNSEMRKTGLSFEERKAKINKKINWCNDSLNTKYQLLDVYSNLWAGAWGSLERVGVESFMRINWELLTTNYD